MANNKQKVQKKKKKAKYSNLQSLVCPIININNTKELNICLFHKLFRGDPTGFSK